jgi:hypothetical protein
MLPALFEQFKQTHKISTEVNRESAHPYSKKYSTKEITSKGASGMVIEFTENSQLEERDTILFTYDREGTRFVEDMDGAGCF